MDAVSSGTLQSSASEQESSKSGSTKSETDLDAKEIDFTKDNGKFATSKLY